MPREYDGEPKAKAMRSVIDLAQDYSSGYEAISAEAGRLGMAPETLRNWLREVYP